MTLDGKILQGIFEHKRLKPTVIRTNQGNVQNLADLRQTMNTDLKFNEYSQYPICFHKNFMEYNINFGFFTYNDRK